MVSTEWKNKRGRFKEMNIKEPKIEKIEIELTEDEFILLCYVLFYKIDESNFSCETIEFDIFGKRRRFYKKNIADVKDTLEYYFKSFQNIFK